AHCSTCARSGASARAPRSPRGWREMSTRMSNAADGARGADPYVPPMANTGLPGQGAHPMYITVATPSFASVDQVDSVIAKLDGPPEGMRARYIGTTDDG